MKRSLILTAFSLLVLAQLGLAQMPQTISYQGVLRDPGTKEIVPNDNYDLTFRLYDASDGGAEWWSETHVGVQVTDGIFNVILGSINSFISTDPKTKFEIPYWLEIAVGASTLSPRIQLTAVPYSLAARSVQGYRNVFPSNGNVGIGTTTPGAKLHIQSPNLDGIVLTDSTTGAYRATLLNQETYGGQLNLNDAADGAVKAVIRGYATVEGYQASFTAGNVGIGTTSPNAKLEVEGASDDAVIVKIDQIGIDNYVGLNLERDDAEKWHIGMNDINDYLRFRRTASSDDMVIDAAGNVGIGTATPEANLQVVGNWILGPSGTPPGGFDSWLSGGSGILYEGGGADFAHHFSAYGGGDIARFGMSPGAGQAPDSRVVITNSGNVGIGTTSPTNRLHINSASSTVTNLQITNSSSGSTGTDGLKIGFVGSNNANVWNNENSGLVFGTNNLEQMRILNNGNVGIGIATPAFKLEVAGDASILGNLDVQGTITQGLQTEYYSFGVRDATSGTYGGGDENYARSYRFDEFMWGSINLAIPLHLPHGATITGITIYIDDADVISSVQCRLYSMASTDFTLLESSLTPQHNFYTTNSGPHSASTTLSHSVDNQTERYWLRITCGVPEGIGDYIRFYGGQIMYTVN